MACPYVPRCVFLRSPARFRTAYVVPGAESARFRLALPEHKWHAPIRIVFINLIRFIALLFLISSRTL